MAANNNIYPINARRLTGADLIPIFGSFINDDRNKLEELVYYIDTDGVYKDGDEIKEAHNTYSYINGKDIRFVVANKNDVSIFNYNNGELYDERGGATNIQQKNDEETGFRYDGWNYLISDNNAGGIKTVVSRAGNDTSFVLFPELSIKNKISDSKWTGYGIQLWRNDISAKLDEIRRNINNNLDNPVSDNNINLLVSDINTNLLKTCPSYKDNVNFLDDLRNTLKNINSSFDASHPYNINTVKNNFKLYIDNILENIQDDAFTPINASMLRPTYEFDSDILPDTNFRCEDGIYNYRKYYSYQYNFWYYQHVTWWWRPWYWWGKNHYWWWGDEDLRWSWHYAWFWHSWWWNWYHYPKYFGSSNVKVGETVVMPNVFKYNTFFPNEYIPLEPAKYLENNNINNNSRDNNKAFRNYITYLTSTYKSNIYKINSYIKVVNKMVDKIVAVCDYIVYDNDNTTVHGADINYNIIYDKYQRIDLNDNNKALSDSDIPNSFKTDIGNDVDFTAAEKLKIKIPISEFSIVNGIDITLSDDPNKGARKYFPIKPIYLLITPKTLNDTNKIIKYKVNLYQYGNIDTSSVLSFVMYQMPRLITVTFTFNSGGYLIRKDTFGILGNVNNSSPTLPANVNIVTNSEFDEALVRDYHMHKKLGDQTDNAYYNYMPYKYGTRRFYNGSSTIESVVNQENRSKGLSDWPVYEYGELPILALNDQDHIVIFISTLTYDNGSDDADVYNLFNASTYVTFNLHTEDYSSNVSVTMIGHKNMFTDNNIYGAHNGNWLLHWGSNITGTNFRAYPDINTGLSYRNSNANVMFSHINGYRIYLKHWFTKQQVSTSEITVNGKRLKISFVWVNLGVSETFWADGLP